MSKEKTNRKKTSSRAYRIAYAIFAGIVGVIFNIKVKRYEEESDKGRFIVCANHTSATDAIVICYAFRKHQVRFMAKKELFKVPVLAPLIRLLGAFPIDRGGNDVGAIKTAVSLVAEGKVLGIFPQGHRYPGEDPRKTRTKNGMALIATKAQANIVPAYIWRKNNRFRLFRRTYIILGDMIPFESLCYEPEASGEYARITNVVFDKICNIGEEFERERKEKKNKKRKA